MGKEADKEVNILKNIFFGLVSGLSGFLPVSASAHENLYCMMTGMEKNALLMLCVHAGALLALIVQYFRQLKHMQREMRIAGAKKHKRMRQPDLSAVADVRMIMTAAIPIIVGILFGTRLSDEFGKLWIMSILLIMNGVLLYALQFTPAGQKDSRSMSPLDGVLYGICKALSVLPGISGIVCVMLAGRSRGGERGYMLDFAMLLMIPWLIGCIALDLIGIVAVSSFSLLILIGAVLSAAAAFAGAYGAIALMRYLAVRIDFHGFAYYSWGAGLVCLILYLMI